MCLSTSVTPFCILLTSRWVLTVKWCQKPVFLKRADSQNRTDIAALEVQYNTLSLHYTIPALKVSKMPTYALAATLLAHLSWVPTQAIQTWLYFSRITQSRRWDSNPQPTDYKSVAQPIVLHRHILWGWWDSNPLTKRTSFTDWLNSPTLTHPQIDFLPYPNVSLKSNSVVGLVGFEPTRSEETRFTVWRANQLLNRPKKQNALLYLPKK